MAVKRKQDDEESPHHNQLEMLSEEGNEDMDDFPQLNIQSDSDESETGYSTAEDDDDSEENGRPEIEPDYDSDSSTEDAPNRIGNVPPHWYDDLPHIGYDINGKQILRPARGDELDKFLATVENPSAWTSAFDTNTQMDKPLTSEELELIRRLYANEVPDANYDPYEPTIEWFTGEGKEEIMPISGALQPKRRWVPSKWEKQKVLKIVRAIRQGRILPSKPKNTFKFVPYAIWSEPSISRPPPLPAPKPHLPTNAESYNPPQEYLPTEEERQAWESLDPEDRERDYLPQKYTSLRLVPAYNSFIQERFNRQLDLYLAPRIQRVKLNIDPNTLIPKLPSPNSLKPFPIYRSICFRHSHGRARCVSLSPDGVWAITGGDEGVVSLWELAVGREIKKWRFKSKIAALGWCPRTDVSYFVVAVEETIHFMIPPNVSSAIMALTHAALAPTTLPPPPANPSTLKWITPASNLWSIETPILTIHFPNPSGATTYLYWHRRGDYLASVSSGSSHGVWIHQVTRRHSQAPFKKVKGSVQLVLFHPSKPHFFVATQQYVRMYNLAEQKLMKTLTPGIKWISSMDIHPLGDHLIVGGYDRKLCWFDLELSDKPYKILRYHSRAIRSLQFHPSYPLFASSSDDGTIQIFHARVYSDLMTDPLIVPLKILRGHEVVEGLGVLQVKWCSNQPWLVSAGADGQVSVWFS